MIGCKKKSGVKHKSYDRIILKIGSVSSMKNNNVENKFITCVNEGKLNISTIEDIMLEDIENYKEKLIAHIEELLLKKIDEKDLISKKKITGMIKELKLRIRAPKH